MNRRSFIGILTGGTIMSTLAINNLLKLPKSEKMPVIFAGHGSPMNAVADNSITRKLRLMGENLPRPKVILVVSAHWLTEGTFVTAMNKPKTIHDFGGFPQELFDIQYPAPGSAEVAEDITKLIVDPKIQTDENSWGLDHGTWSVLRHMYPLADIPVLQLSIDITKPPEYHVQLGQQLQKLRERGVMILGSGNIVHNLRRIKWEDDAEVFDWAVEFDDAVKRNLMERNIKALQQDFYTTEAGKLSVPTPDHYYPLLYTLGAADSSDDLKFEIEAFQNASISMRTLRFG